MLAVSLHWPFIRIERRTMGFVAVGWVALIIHILAGSTYNTFAKELTHGLSPMSLLFLSELFTAFFIMLSFGTVPTLQRASQLGRRHVAPLFLVGVTSGTLAPLLWFLGLRSTTAVNASFISNVEIVFMALMGIWILGERWTKGHSVAAAVIAFGTAIIAFHGFSQSLTLSSGDALILLAGLCFSIGSMVFRVLLHDVEPHIVLLVRAACGVAAFFLISPFVEHPFIEEIMTFPIALVLPLIGFAFVSKFLNVWTFYVSLDRLPVVTVSLLSSLAIIGSVLFAALYLGEPIAWYHIVGGGLILLGSLLFERVGLLPTEEHLERHLRTHPRIRQ